MTADQSPAFSFYAKDFMLGTIRMSLSERGAYITLLAYQWDCGSVPTDPVELGRVLGCSRVEAAKLWAVVRAKFQAGDDGAWRNPRLESERQKQTARREALAANGRKGGRPTGNLTETKRFPESEPKPNQIESLPSPSPSPKRVPTELSVARASNFDVIPDEDPLLRRAGKLLERYAELFQQHRRGAKYHNRMHLDFPKACELVKTWSDDARLEKLAVIVLTTDDEWIARTDRGFGIFAARASWADDRLTTWETEQQVRA